MPKMVYCTYNGKETSINEALQIKADCGESSSKLGFLCVGCNCLVRAHRSLVKGGPKPHFEHFKENPKCPLI